MSDDRTFPIQARRGTTEPKSIPWADAKIAYRAYCYLYGTGQSLERLAERGGFGWVEYLALNDTAVWWRSNPQASHRQLHDVFEKALMAQTAMNPDPRRR